MSDTIRVTCQSCNHSVKAPRAAAGKYGKCPNCHNRVYVPTPESDLEIIPLVGDDDTDKTRLDAEAREINAALLRERLDDEISSSDQRQGAKPTTPRASAAKKTDLKIGVADAVVKYVVALQQSDLEQSDAMLSVLRASIPQAKSKAQQLMVDAMPPPPLSDLPPALYQGFLKKLIEELDQ